MSEQGTMPFSVAKTSLSSSRLLPEAETAPLTKSVLPFVCLIVALLVPALLLVYVGVNSLGDPRYVRFVLRLVGSLAALGVLVLLGGLPSLLLPGRSHGLGGDQPSAPRAGSPRLGTSK